MKNLVKILLYGLLMFIFNISLNSQTTSITYHDQPRAKINMGDFHDPYAFSIKYLEAPHPSGKAHLRAYLRQQKLKAQRATPVNPTAVIENRGSIPAPEIIASFSGNNVITGTPLDNHLAVNESEQVVSTINTHMLVTNSVGFWQGSYKLEPFYAAVGTTDRFFDPRVIYDPEQDRFIMVLINGSVCDDSQIVLAFSESNDPRGNWHLYALDGCLNDDGTFADFPMISITKTDFFLTYNAVHSDSTWQAGFYGTQIHQINKMNGYNGETLNRRVWKDVSYNGKLLRNVCPVRNADENLPVDMYFLSNRNFDLTNDTIFLLHIEGEQADSSTTLDINYRILDNPYGVPPYAIQPRDSLDTNDARVLDAFEQNGQIQWVGNTMDFATGRSAIYHGTLEIDDPFQNATGNIIAHPTDYLGYPGIAWTGTNPDERDAIIVMSHASLSRNPGGSAVYSDGKGEYSDIIPIIEGQRSVDMLTGTIERWGDYAGMQRLYHQPGSIWTSLSYARFNFANEAWIAKLARFEEGVSTNDVKSKTTMTTYPNPTDDYVQINIENPDGGHYHVVIMDMTGRPVKTLYNGPANFPGKASINFSTHALPQGQYVVNVMIDEKLAASKMIVKQ